jgi:signal transduction histidine kinase
VIVPRSYFAKLLWLFLGYGALMTGVLIFVMHVSHTAYHLELDQLRSRDLAQQYVAAHLLVREPPLTVHNFARSLKHITEINPDIDLYVLDASGQILAGSADHHPFDRHLDLEPVRKFVSGEAAFPLLGDNPADSRHRAIFSAAPLSIPGCPAAYLYIVLTHHDAPSAIQRLKLVNDLGTDAAVILAAAFAAIIASVLFLRYLTRRLGTLQEDMESFRDTGVVPDPLRNSTCSRCGDEIEALRGLFVQLAAQVHAQLQELRRTDRQRRELLANISHDLKTPLATLQVHLEILSQSELPHEERNTYVGVALQQCRRLVSLVEKLLTLAKLDAREITLALEPFQLAELAQDVAMKWALAARHAGVSMSAEPPSGRVPFVIGDVRWIEKVMDSLLDNALRYAGSGGQVTLRVAPDESAVRLCVHDSGAGIPEAERTRIFDELYRGDASRSTRSGEAGLGLGLPIARAILALHGQSIDFRTEPNQGTTFFFQLPRADRSAFADGARPEMPRRGAV